MDDLIKTLIQSVINLLLDSLILMFFWNWLIPDLFGLTVITYGEALLLVIIGHSLTGAHSKQ